jgi:hypothetical protein
MRAFVFLLLASAATGLAQDFAVPMPAPREIVPVEVEEPRPSIEGIVKEIFVTKKPWQMVNPLAPAKYGSGEKMVSKDFESGTPVKSAGLIVAGVEW